MDQRIKWIAFISVMALLITVVGCETRGGSDEVPAGVTFPHPDGWELFFSHGAEAQDLGNNSCTPCHGEDYQGGFTGVSCFSCHQLYPHEEGWADITGHGEYLEANDFNNFSCATNCHGNDFNGGFSQISCFSCHSLYPHSSTWKTAPDFTQPHADYVEANGDSACINCHVDIKASFQLLNPQCQYCH